MGLKKLLVMWHKKPDFEDCSTSSASSSTSSLDSSCSTISSSFESEVTEDVNDISCAPVQKEELHHKKNIRYFKEGDEEAGLNANQKMIYSAVLSTLKDELIPQVTKLAEDSQKYRTLKTIYHLPSITDLRKELKDPADIKVKMNVDNDRLALLIQQKSFRAVPATKTSQRLTTIPENVEPVPKVHKFKSSCQDYNRLTDKRDIRKIDNEELKDILEKINKGRFPELTLQQWLLGRYQARRSHYIVGFMTNKSLKSRIVKILSK